MTLPRRLFYLRRRPAGSSPEPSRHLWAGVTATTVDGVTAHIQVEFTRDITSLESSPVAFDQMAMDAVEGALHHHVATLPASSLPMTGDGLGWVEAELVPHTVIGNVFVISSDIEVSTDLRRRLIDSDTGKASHGLHKDGGNADGCG